MTTTTAKITIETRTKTTIKRLTASPPAGQITAERDTGETSTTAPDPRRLPGAGLDLFSTPDTLK
jgi:hypothetical protein